MTQFLKSRTLLACAVLSLSVSATANEFCNPTSVDTCTLPFPSNYWSEQDANSPTGMHLNFSDDSIRPEILAELPVQDGFSPAGLFNGDSGYSAATPVIFEFNSTPDADTLPADGGSAIIAIDMNTGEQLEVRAQVSDYAQSDRVSSVSDVIEIFPRSRWAYGHDILVAVTTDLELAEPELGILSKLVTTDSEDFAYTSDLVAKLTANGINPLSVRNATTFKVRDRAEVVEPMFSAIDDVWDREHPVRNLDMTYNYVNRDIAGLLKGEVLVYNYRTNGGTGVVDFDAEPIEQWIEFRLTIPASSRDGGAAPVALYAHGLGANKETDTTVSKMNAEIGIATYSVGFPNHGDRTEFDGGYVMSILSPDQLSKTIGMVVHNAIDFASAHRALQTTLAEVDFVGPKSWRSWYGNKADGVADIDATRVMMQGTSLGGVLGSVYGATSPDLKGSVYHVTGIGVTSILSGSILWEAMFASLVPPSANGAEAVMLRSAIQQFLDSGDSINYMDYFRNPRIGNEARPLMLTMGAGDTIVTNDSTVAAAHIGDLPVVGESLTELNGVRVEADYDDGGYGIRQYKPVVGTVPLIWDGAFAEAASNASGHLIFTRASDRPDQQEFIKRFIFTDL
ncbi:MAG: hypothetical protein KUG48_00395 [Oleibacter sp.]|nr:hypothetical protein [Thalassolituus sp.]